MLQPPLATARAPRSKARGNFEQERHGHFVDKVSLCGLFTQDFKVMRIEQTGAEDSIAFYTDTV